MESINYFLAIGYALVGWVVQVTYYYFTFDTEEAFDKAKFWRVYDKYIILGFVSSIAFALMGDFAWPSVTEYFNWRVQYDERVNVLIGLFSCLIIMFLSRKAKEKLE